MAEGGNPSVEEVCHSDVINMEKTILDGLNLEDLGIDLSDIESIEIGTNKGNEIVSGVDMMSHLMQRNKDKESGEGLKHKDEQSSLQEKVKDVGVNSKIVNIEKTMLEGLNLEALGINLEDIESIELGTSKPGVQNETVTIGDLTNLMQNMKHTDNNSTQNHTAVEAAETTSALMDRLTADNSRVVNVDKAMLEGLDLQALGIDLEDIESIEFGTKPVQKKESLTDLMTELHSNIKSSDWLEKQNKAVEKDKDSILQAIKEAAADKSMVEDFEIIPSAGGQSDDELTQLFREFYSTVKTSGWLKENTVEKMKAENPELYAGYVEMKDKKTPALPLDELPLPGEYEILTQENAANAEEAELLGMMTTLHHQIRSSDWVEKQNERLKQEQIGGKSQNIPECQGACAASSSPSALDLLTAQLQGCNADQKPDELEDLMRDLHHSIRSSDWLKENTVEKMRAENPELIAAILKSREEEKS